MQSSNQEQILLLSVIPYFLEHNPGLELNTGQFYPSKLKSLSLFKFRFAPKVIMDHDIN